MSNKAQGKLFPNGNNRSNAKKGKRKESLDSMLTEERTATFHRQVNWKERDIREPGLQYVFHHQGNWESRETSVQHDFRGLLLWCQPVTTYRTADTRWEQLRVHTPHTHTPYSVHCFSSALSFYLPLHEIPQLKSTFKFRRLIWFILSASHLIFTKQFKYVCNNKLLINALCHIHSFVNWSNK